MLRRLMGWASLPAVIVMMMAGCEGEEPIASYIAPRDPPPEASARHDEAARHAEPAQADVHLHWTLPAGWRQASDTGPMREATLIADTDDEPFEVAVIRLGGQGGDLLANINRWRGQLGLDPISRDDEVRRFLKPVHTPHIEGVLVDLLGPAADADDPYAEASEPPAGPRKRMLVAIFPAGRSIWFFKVTADEAVMRRHEPAFMQLLESVRPDAPHAAPVERAAVAESAQAPTGPGTWRGFEVGPIRGTFPGEWRTSAQVRPPRLASFQIVRGDQQADVSITRFPGRVGGELANVNRWRNQVGLPPVDELAQQDSVAVTVDGIRGRVYQFVAPGIEPDRPRIVVAVLPRGDMSWFFKMSGPSDLLQTQVEPFVNFVVSIQFTDSTDAANPEASADE